jgi:hypothetical protein
MRHLILEKCSYIRRDTYDAQVFSINVIKMYIMNTRENLMFLF